MDEDDKGTDMRALRDPHDPNTTLSSGCPCGQHASLWEHQMATAGLDSKGSRFACVGSAAFDAPEDDAAPEKENAPSWDDEEAVISRLVDAAAIKSLFGTDLRRRSPPCLNSCRSTRSRPR